VFSEFSLLRPLHPTIRAELSRAAIVQWLLIVSPLVAVGSSRIGPSRELPTPKSPLRERKRHDR
jgi:hypothetical protein